ncbi:hypothetical protein CN359_30965, partial [Bacillus thuringiensis]
ATERGLHGPEHTLDAVDESLDELRTGVDECGADGPERGDRARWECSDRTDSRANAAGNRGFDTLPRARQRRADGGPDARPNPLDDAERARDVALHD